MYNLFQTKENALRRTLFRLFFVLKVRNGGKFIFHLLNLDNNCAIITLCLRKEVTCLNKELLLLLLKLAAGCVVIMTFIVIACLITPKIARFIEKRHPELESRCRSVGLSLESYISKLSQWLFTKGRHCTDPYRIISGWLDNDSKRKTAAKPKEKQGCDLSWYDDYAMNFDLSKFF